MVVRYTSRLLAFLLFIAAQHIKAQLIHIPDAQLASLYNTWVPGCVDVNGDLDASLPAVQAYDGIAIFDSSPIGIVNGLDAFTSLVEIRFLWSGSISIIEALPPGLERLELTGLPSGAQLPPLPLGLKRLRIDYVSYSYPFPDIVNTQLEGLFINELPYDQTLGELPPSLKSISIHSSEGLIELPALPNGLDSLFIGQCFYLNTLPPLPDSLKVIHLDDCPVEVLPPLPTGLREMYLSFLSVFQLPELPHTLRQIAITGLPVSCLPILPDSLEYFDQWVNNIHCLPNEPPNCLMSGTWNLELCSALNSVCPGLNPTIGGQVFHDLNGNGLEDPEDPGSNYVSVIVDPIGMAGGVPVGGHFDVGLPIGDYTVSCVPNYSFVQAITPATNSAALPEQTSIDTDNNFALTMSVMEDFAVTIATTPSVPGFESVVWLTVTNQGTVAADVPVSLVLDADQTLIASDPEPAMENGNSLTWLADNMAMGEQRTISLVVQTGFTVPLGTSLIHMVSLPDLPNDIIQENNTATSSNEVVGSYDPNDKTVSPSVLDQSALGEAILTYTVRFQNTGTYMAQRVLVTDTLSAALDWTSFRFQASSHVCNWTLFNGVLRFTFDAIMLPDSASNESDSHGFLTFTIEPSTSAGIGPIGNTANIFFDFNVPVITNEAIVDVSNAVPETFLPELRVFPVPADQTIWLQRKQGEPTGVRIMDTQGRVVMERTITGLLVAIPVGELPPGAYILADLTGNGARASFLKR